jgi:hypothetical protein
VKTEKSKLEVQQEQLDIPVVSCRFVLKDKLVDSYYKYTFGGRRIWTGDIKLAKKFKYRLVAYVYLLFLDWKDSVVVKTCN